MFAPDAGTDAGEKGFGYREGKATVMPTAADVIAGKARWSAEQSDALEWLRSLPDGCARMCVTSPPYYGLRDYGTAKWEGGDEGCDHDQRRREKDSTSKESGYGGQARDSLAGRDTCRKCGARRVDEQIGLEETPAAYVAKLVAVFREVWRVLADDGTLWLNLGDSYSGSGKSGGGEQGADWEEAGARIRGPRGGADHPTPVGTKPKDLLGIPWLVAFALRDDGWYLRQDIIWAKPNPMPESVTDRCTKAHEYLFLLSKSARYYYDAGAIAEKSVYPAPDGTQNDSRKKSETGSGRNDSGRKANNLGFYRKPNGGACFGKQKHDTAGTGAQSRTYERPVYDTRNRRSVWTVTTKPYKGAHFATFPPDLITPCILAGSAPDDIVIEPFSGSGTTLAVAVDKGRRAIGCELNPAYCRLIERRLRKVTPPLFTEAV